MKPKYNLFLWFALLTLLMNSFSSCSVRKHLRQGEYLIKKNEVILNDEAKVIKEESKLTYELSSLITQKKNSKFLFFFKPEVSAYYKSKPVDEEKINSEKYWTRFGAKLHRWYKRKFTEAPVLYDTTTMNLTEVRMKNYLNSKGYFDAEVSSDAKLKKWSKKAKIRYYVNPGVPYTVDSLIYESEDPAISPMLDYLKKETYFKPGALLDKSLYNKEVVRVSDTLRNNGYAYFYPSYMQELEADSTGSAHSLTVYSKIDKPFEEEEHRIYRFGSISIYANFNINDSVEEMRDSIINGITYFSKNGDLGIKASVLERNIFIKQGKLFDQRVIAKTNKQLSALGIYKFVNIRQVKSETSEDEIDIVIYLSKAKKQNINFRADVNNSERTLSSTRTFFIGTVANVSYGNRNTFNGAENFGLSLEGGVEFNLTDRTKLINSLDMVGRLDVLLPEFFDISGTWSFLDLLHFKNFYIVNPKFIDELREKSKPVGTFSYNIFSLLDFYTLNSVNASWGYDLKRNNTEQYRINTVGLTLFRSDIKTAFDTTVNNNLFLKKSLEDQFITGFFYSDLNYTWASQKNAFGESWQMRFNHELSGAEALLANYVTNEIRNSNDEFTVANGIKFSQFTKAAFDVRYFKESKVGNTLGLRAHIGMAVPYGGFSTVVPYVKQFSIGGPNSLRAWTIRELGPGKFNDVNTTEAPFYQAADFIFEFNAEYRFKFIPFFAMDGAIFLDGGNIWTLREDIERPGSQFKMKNFLNEIALGTGFGTRIDFSYVVVRFDVGLRIRSPFVNEHQSNWYFEGWKFGELNDVLGFNLALGYPF